MATLLRSTARHFDCDVVRRHHYDLVRRTPYSPIPDLPPASAPVWTRKSDMPGIELDLDAQLDWLRRCLAPSLAEFMARFVHCSGPRDLSLNMGFPDGPNHPEVQDVIDKAIAIMKDAGITAGITAGTRADAAKQVRAGFTQGH